LHVPAGRRIRLMAERALEVLQAVATALKAPPDRKPRPSKGLLRAPPRRKGPGGADPGRSCFVFGGPYVVEEKDFEKADRQIPSAAEVKREREERAEAKKRKAEGIEKTIQNGDHTVSVLTVPSSFGASDSSSKRDRRDNSWYHGPFRHWQKKPLPPVEETTMSDGDDEGDVEGDFELFYGEEMEPETDNEENWMQIDEGAGEGGVQPDSPIRPATSRAPLIGLHVSISRTLSLRFHWIQGFLNQIESAVAGVDRSVGIVEGTKMLLLLSEDGKRLFCAASVTSSQLDNLIDAVDKVCEMFGLPKYFPGPLRRPHLSLAWMNVDGLLVGGGTVLEQQTRQQLAAKFAEGKGLKGEELMEWKTSREVAVKQAEAVFKRERAKLWGGRGVGDPPNVPSSEALRTIRRDLLSGRPYHLIDWLDEIFNGEAVRNAPRDLKNGLVWEMQHDHTTILKKLNHKAQPGYGASGAPAALAAAAKAARLERLEEQRAAAKAAAKAKAAVAKAIPGIAAAKAKAKAKAAAAAVAAAKAKPEPKPAPKALTGVPLGHLKKKESDGDLSVAFPIATAVVCVGQRKHFFPLNMLGPGAHPQKMKEYRPVPPTEKELKKAARAKAAAAASITRKAPGPPPFATGAPWPPPAPF